MKISKEKIMEWYSRLFDSLNTYPLKIEELCSKTKACYDLMGEYDEDIFVAVCQEWLEKENDMATAKQLSSKCYEMVKKNKKEQQKEEENVCEHMRVKKQYSYRTVEFEEEICKHHGANIPFYNQRNELKYRCYFHWATTMEKDVPGRNTARGIFSLCKNQTMTYVESEIFIHKYSKSDMKTRNEILATLDHEHQQAIKKYEKNLDEENCIRSSVTSVFKSIDKF